MRVERFHPSQALVYLAAGRDVSEREANISEILIILFVALDIFPLADGLGQVHHAQWDLDLIRNTVLVLRSFPN